MNLQLGLLLLTVFASAVHGAILEQAPFNVKQDAVKQIITPQLSEFVEGLRVDSNIPGLTLGLVHSDGRVELGAWGHSDEDGTLMASDTLFVMASCSKAFLSASLGILMDDFALGRNVTALPHNVKVFDWGTKLIDLLPEEWYLEDEWATKKASLKDILSHVSGMPRHDFADHAKASPADVLHNLRRLRLSFELREKWAYNNLMYIVGSHIIALYSGMTYVDFVKDRIFIPLDMSSSTYSPTEAARDNKLTQSWTAFGRRLPTWFTDHSRDLNAGPGGVISNAMDMTKWLRVLLNKGVNMETNTTVIPRSAFEAVTTSHVIMDGRAPSPQSSISGYGMGWSRESIQGHEFVSHTGGIPGFSTTVGFLPSDDLGIVVLANADSKHGAEMELVKRVMKVALVLNTTAWEFTSSSDIVHSPSSQTPRPQNTTEPTLPIDEYAGKYWGDGYGSLTLCSQTSSSPTCREVLDDFSVFEDVTAERSRLTLWSKHPTMWSSHIRMQHVDGDRWMLGFTTLFLNGYGKNTTPFQTWEEGQGLGEVAVSFETRKEHSRTESHSVIAFGFMGTDEEHEGRRRLVGAYLPFTDIIREAQVLMMRVGGLEGI